MTSAIQEAYQAVYGDRHDAYGPPLQDFQRVAVIWSGILNMLVTPEQVGLCLAGLKIAREAYFPRRDNRVDLAGYAECLELIAQMKEAEGCPTKTTVLPAEPCSSASEAIPSAAPATPSGTTAAPATPASAIGTDVCPKCQRFLHPTPHQCDP